MKILYITSTPLEYSSSANLRNIALMRGLIENGHEVSTLTTRAQKESSYYDRSILDLPIAERYYVELGKVHSKLTSSNSDKSRKTIMRRIKGILYKAYTSFHLYDSRKSEAGEVRSVDFGNVCFDVVISSSDPKSSHIFAENLFKAYPDIAKRWIQYWGDPFTGDINRKSLCPDFFVAKEEKRLISKCDKAVYVSPLTCEYIKNKYPNLEDKVAFIPIGYAKEKIYSLQENDRISLCYCGDYYSSDRDITPLLNATRDLSSLCRLTVAGNSDLEIAESDNLTILPRVERKKVDDIENESDVIVCVCNRGGTQIPGKIYHASATNRAVLILLDGDKADEIKKYFEKYDRFYFCKNTVEDIKEFIKSIDIKGLNAAPCEALSAKKIAMEFLE